jgi:hypothetical protein
MGGSGIGFDGVTVPARQYAHPQFRYRSPEQSFRRRLWLGLACVAAVGIGAVMMAPSSASKSDAALYQVSRPETIPTVSPVGYASVDAQPGSANRSQVAAQKPICLGPSQSDGSCLSFQLPKVRMVRVPRASTLSQHGNQAKLSIAANAKAKDVDKGIAEPKKVQRSAHHQSQRRKQSSARAYASRERGYYGHQGFAGNFW